MRLLRQFGVIMAVTCVGEIIRFLVPLPIPASVYGLCLMFFLLFSRIVKVSQVKEAGTFLIEIMPLMFIPAAVGLITSWELIKGWFIQIISITVISTFLVMISSGKVTERLLKGQKK